MYRSQVKEGFCRTRKAVSNAVGEAGWRWWTAQATEEIDKEDEDG